MKSLQEIAQADLPPLTYQELPKSFQPQLSWIYEYLTCQDIVYKYLNLNLFFSSSMYASISTSFKSRDDDHQTRESVRCFQAREQELKVVKEKLEHLQEVKLWAEQQGHVLNLMAWEDVEQHQIAVTRLEQNLVDFRRQQSEVCLFNIRK